MGIALKVRGVLSEVGKAVVARSEPNGNCQDPRTVSAALLARNPCLLEPYRFKADLNKRSESSNFVLQGTTKARPWRTINSTETGLRR